MAEGIRAPNLPLGTNPTELMGLEQVGTTKSLRRYLVSALMGATETRLSTLEATNATSGWMKTYSSRAALLADSTPDQHTMAQVRGDANPAYNGIYEKTSTSWNRVADLPDSIIDLFVTGGTANAIEASAAPQVPATPDNKLYIFEPTANNTDAVTIKVGSRDAVPIKSLLGVDLTENALVSGVPVLMSYISGEYRLMLASPVEADSVLASVLAAKGDAETAASAAASDAAALGNQVHQYDTRAQAAAATIPTGVTSIRIYRYAAGHPIYATNYVQGTSDGPGAFQDAGGTWWEIDVSDGKASVLSFGAPLDPGDDSTDATAMFTAASTAAKYVDVPIGRFVVSQWLPPEGTTINGAGVGQTVIKQKPAVSGGNYDFPVVWIKAKNTKLVGGFTIEGNIADDTGEWNHAVQVGSYDGGEDIDITGVEIGDIEGINIRGDVVYIGGTPDARIGHIEIGAITGKNILRSPLSVTGGRSGHVRSIDCEQYCYRGAVFEPNGAGSQEIGDWTIDYLRAGNFGLAGNLGNYVGRIKVGTMILDSDIQVETVPPYLHGDGTTHYFDKDIGVYANNFDSLEIDRLICNKKVWSAINSSSTDRKGRIIVREYSGTGNGTAYPSQGEFHLIGISAFILDNFGTINLPVDADSIMVVAETDTFVSVSNGTLNNGRVISQGAERSEFHNMVIIPGPTSLGPLFFNLSYPVWDRIVTVGTTNVFSRDCRYGTFTGCNIAASDLSDNGEIKHTAIASVILGVEQMLKNLSA